MTKVSVIIVNWNGKDYIIKCIESLMDLDYEDYEIIVVDNGSSDGSQETLRKKFPSVRLIENENNLGFAEGNNIGIKKACEDPAVKYIVVLNNDTVVLATWLRELVTVAELNDEIGSCQSKMLRYCDRNIIDSTGIKLFPSGAVADRGSGEADNGQYEKIEEVFGSCAGAALYRRKMLDEIGLFPCEYFASYEDVDLAWRARYGGWKCVYVPTAIVYHVRFATQSRLLEENQAYYAQKIRNQLFYQIKYLPSIYLLKNSGRLAKLYFRYIKLEVKNGYASLRELIYLLPKIMFARREYHRNRKSHRTVIYEWLEKK